MLEIILQKEFTESEDVLYGYMSSRMFMQVILSATLLPTDGNATWTNIP